MIAIAVVDWLRSSRALCAGGMLRSPWFEHWLTAVCVLEWMVAPSVFRALLWGALSGASTATSGVATDGGFVALFDDRTAWACRGLLAVLGWCVSRHVSRCCSLQRSASSTWLCGLVGL